MVEQAEILENDADPAAERPGGRSAMFSPNTKISPREAFSDMKRRRKSEVFPAPDGPVRK